MTPNEKDWEEKFDNRFAGAMQKNNNVIRADFDVLKHLEIKDFILTNFISRKELERVIEVVGNNFVDATVDQALQDLKSKFLNVKTGEKGGFVEEEVIINE